MGNEEPGGDLAEDPILPVLECPLDYDIVQVLLRLGDVAEPFIELTVARDSERRRLRFLGPRVVQIDEGFEKEPRGLLIRDISSRGIGALKLRVEAADGTLRFWARWLTERPASERELPLRPRTSRRISELREVLERYDPRLTHRLEWLRPDPKQAHAPIRSVAQAPARTQRAAPRYFVISTK